MVQDGRKSALLWWGTPTTGAVRTRLERLLVNKKKVFFAGTLSIDSISSAPSTDSVRFPKFLVAVEK